MLLHFLLSVIILGVRPLTIFYCGLALTSMTIPLEIQVALATALVTRGRLVIGIDSDSVLATDCDNASDLASNSLLHNLLVFRRNYRKEHDDLPAEFRK